MICYQREILDQAGGPDAILHFHQIVALLEHQSRMRSLENDLGGCLLAAAQKLRDDYYEVVGFVLDDTSNF